MSHTTSSEIPGVRISHNSKAVLLGLFLLVAFIILVYTIVINNYSPVQAGRLNTVFIAAISGSLALGGTLISQLWGKSGNVVEPDIYATNPPPGANNVPLDTSISASFNMLMDKSTINDNTFTLMDKNNKKIDGKISFEGGNAILKPDIPLESNMQYKAKITKDAKSMTGCPLKSDEEWTFTTRE
jgi:hypothetical protein